MQREPRAEEADRNEAESSRDQAQHVARYKERRSL
jgi:hypothetical protein